MKKLLVLLFLSISSSMFSQDYKPLLDDLNEWKFTTCFFGCLTDTYYTNGDTLVNGQPHKILDGYHYISRSFLLKENIQERKVYLTKINANTIEEFLLYDFSLTEGDSIEMKNPYTPFPENGGYFILDSIKSQELFDGMDYRHYYFSPAQSNTTSTNSPIWIEGMGSLSLINAPGGEPDINGVGHVSCYFKNEMAVYQNLDSINVCEPSVSLEIKQHTTPLHKVLLLSRAKERKAVLYNTENLENVTVYDVYGKIYKTLKNNNLQKVEINFEEAASGIYLLKVEDKFGFKKTFKFLLQ